MSALYETPDIKKPLEAFGEYVAATILKDVPMKFSFIELGKYINESVFEAIPEIEQLNHPRVSSGSGYENRHSEPHPDKEEP